MTMEISPDAFRSYAFWSAILAVKILLMSLMTSCQRALNDCFASPEDVVLFGRNKKLPANRTVEPVERVRRAHQNDLEGILPFFALGLLFCYTQPSVWIASILFSVFAIVRIAHTVVYVFIPMQPARGICFLLGQVVNFILAIRIIMYFCS